MKLSKLQIAFIIFAVGLGFRFYKEWEIISRQEITSWKIDQSADCAVVLTGGAGRIREGFDLLANHKIKKLILSGVNNKVQLSDLMPMLPLYGDIDEKDVVMDKRSETTYGNAQQSLPLVEALHCRDILLVTSRLHMYRAFRTFRSTFPDQIFIQQHSVNGGKKDSLVSESLIETIKSLFYSFWAFDL